jgi:hypothetical protein
MDKRYRGPKGATPTDDEFVLDRSQLVQNISNYTAWVATLTPPPLEYLEGLRYLQQAAESARPDELPVYRAKFQEIIST